jgi:hypothetical protein
LKRETLISNLKKALVERHVVTVVGCGVSVAACGNQEVEGHKVATWQGLLHHGLEHCKAIGVFGDDDIALIKPYIDSGKTNYLISAAEEITNAMQERSPGEYQGWLKSTVGALAVSDPTILHALAALPGVLVTLNYENLIEDATGRRPVTWRQPDAVQDVLLGRKPKTVLHLHGYYEDPDSIVLGLKSYLKVKDDPHAKATLQLFTMDRTLLFVGCGDTVLDPNFTRLIEWGGEALKDVAPRHFLLCRTSEIAAFQAKLLDAPWLQPLAYGDTYEELPQFLLELAPGASMVADPPAPTLPDLDFSSYRQAIHKLHNRIKLEDIAASSHDVRVTLTGMFIEQHAKECAEFMPPIYELPKELQQHWRDSGKLDAPHLDEATLEQYKRAYQQQSARSVLDVLRDPTCNRAVILGDPGSGKSTLLQYLLLEWSSGGDAVGDSLPLLIELREYARLRGENQIGDFLAYLCSGACVRFHFDRAALEKWLRQAPSKVLFDGLDEIFDPVMRREVIMAIHRFADAYPQARIVVTSRIVGYQHQVWNDEGFRHFLLQDLDSEQISRFLSQWHTGAYEDQVKGETRRARLAHAIATVPAIGQLAGNPLLLTMMAILNRSQELPHDRAELYKQCAALLLQQWEADMPAHSALSPFALDFKAKHSLLLRVAGVMQAGPGGLRGNLIDEELLEKTLADGLEAMNGVSAASAARALIEQLRGRNFMLCSVGSHAYAFVHRTFLEYFCAAFICEQFEKTHSLSIEELKSDVFGHWPDETWHEVLRLLIGMVDQRYVEEIISWLLQQDDAENIRRPQLLAIECVGEVRRRIKLGALEQEAMDTVKELANFSLPSAVSRVNDEDDVERKIVDNIQSRAINLLTGVWPDVRENLTWLQGYAASGDREVARGTAVHAMARTWKDHPELFLWLLTQAKVGNVIVRFATLLALSDWPYDNPEIPLALKDRIECDERPFLRQFSILALSSRWQGDPATPGILQDCAQSDAEYSVRVAAIRVLINNYRDDLRTLPVLKQCARDNSSEELRTVALQGLSEHWGTDPDIQDLLRDSSGQASI